MTSTEAAPQPIPVPEEFPFEWPDPADTSRTPGILYVSHNRSTLSFSPNCPELFAPQPYNLPLSASRRLWRPPAAMALNRVYGSAGTGVGVSRFVVSPMPS